MRSPSRPLVLLALLALFASLAPAALLATRAPAAPPSPPPREVVEALAAADALYERGAYAEALAAYEAIDAERLPDEEARLLRVRRADARWRSAASTNDPDTTVLDRAREELQEVVRSTPEGRPDLAHALASESLGDFFWIRQNGRDFGSAQPHYAAALSYWADSSDLDAARSRYLGIVFRMARPAWFPPHARYGGWYGNWIDETLLRNAAKIALAPEDRAHAHYLLAQSLARHGAQYATQVERAYETALALGEGTAWRDDALFQFAYFIEAQGAWTVDPDGRRVRATDYPRAVKLYRQLLEEFQRGESRYHDDARARVEQLTSPQVGVSAGRSYFPGSKQAVEVSWRNVGDVRVALHPVDLTEDVEPAGGDDAAGIGAFVERLGSGSEPARVLEVATGDAGRHEPGQRSLVLDPPLPPGAYLVRATAAGASSQDLLLVTDASLVLRATRGHVLAWFAAAENGRPIAGAEVLLLRRYHKDGRWRWSRAEGTTDEDGLFQDADRGLGQQELFVAAKHGERQAFATTWHWTGDRAGEGWKIHVLAERPAFRPGQPVSFRVTARRSQDGRLETPAHAAIAFEVRDPRGGVLHRGPLALDAFGTADTLVETTASSPLGEYSIVFLESEAKDARTLGQAPAFRLEEYKLPEFEVKAAAAEEDGKPKLFAPGDAVEIDVQAQTYFGAPVANAKVEVLVHQRPYHHRMPRPYEFPWLQDEQRAFGRHWQPPAQLVLQTTTTTDEHGKARLLVPTSEVAEGDLELEVEARVTDASRREVAAKASVRVTRQAFFADVEIERKVRRPGDALEATIRTTDPNGKPVSADGRVTLERKRWFERWRGPDGRVAERREGPGWRRIEAGYRSEVVRTDAVSTGAEGVGRWSATVEREGYYELTFSSRDARGEAVQASDHAFVCAEGTTELGYRGSEIEILVDDEGFRAGGVAPILIATRASGRGVLLALEADGPLGHQVLRMDGTVKRVDLTLGEQHVPNFHVTAITFADGVPQLDVAEIVVPPASQFLAVDVQPDRARAEPGGKGRLAVSVRDHEGKPVEAELALSVVDAAVLAIQPRYFPDPRAFFYGEKRHPNASLSTTSDRAPFARDLKQEEGDVVYDDAPEEETWDGLEERKEGGARGRAQSDARRLDDGLAKLGFAGAPGEAAAPTASLALDAAQGADGAPPPGGDVVVEVRSDFRETALWLPDVKTDAEGKASVEVSWPDSVTRWDVYALAVDRGARVGSGASETRTLKPLVVRPQLPRFLVVGDEATLAVLVNNEDEAAQTVRAELEVEGLELLGAWVDGAVAAGGLATAEIAPKQARRFEWRVRAREAGTAKIRASARSERHGDGAERSFGVVEHGIEAFAATSGVLRGSELVLSLDVPAARRAGSERFTVHVAPSLAVTMLDALPYLVTYPYGCTEQTLSRFLPAVVVAKTLKDFGLSPEEAMGRVFGGIEREHVGATQKGERESLAKLDDVTKKGLERLLDFQHADGGWGWWKEGESDPFMSAYVVWGLTLAHEAGVDVDLEALARGARFLDQNLVEAEDAPDLQAWLLHALATWQAGAGEGRGVEHAEAAFQNLWSRHTELNAYGRALAAIAAHHLGKADEAKQLVRNLRNGVLRDDAPESSVVQRGVERLNPATLGLAHWGEDGIFWRWSEGGVEATAFALRAMLLIEPDQELIPPVMNWLVQNRRGAQWSNTRDTAIVVLALNDHLRKSGELSRGVAYEVLVNGERVGGETLAPADLLKAPAEYEIPRERLVDGTNQVVVRRLAAGEDGGAGGAGSDAPDDGPLYVAARASFFSLEEPIPSRGSGLFVRREYFRLVGRPTLLSGHVYDRVPLRSGESVGSGERIEVLLTVEAKNHLEYLVFEDMKPAGLEATEVRSGMDVVARELKSAEIERRFGADGEGDRGDERARFSARSEQEGLTGRTRGVYRELRDRHAALFVDRLPEGYWELRYELRAEIPGVFHGLPTQGHAMYVPEIRCNGDETRVAVTE